MSDDKGDNPMAQGDRQALYAVVDYEKDGEQKSRWLQIGTAFENKDGSQSLRFDAGVSPGMNVQLRPFSDKEQEG